MKKKCGYCGEPVFFAPTLKLLEELSPGHGYFHPNGKNGEILPLFQWLWASVDHINPVTKGGENAESNYVTACWKCNLKFNNLSPEQGKPKPVAVNKAVTQVNWDGFSSVYPKLAKSKDEWVRLLTEKDV
jgi:hypothetical protein